MAEDGETKAELIMRVDELEQAAVVDQGVIAHLADEGVVDRTKIANMEIALVTCRRIGVAMGILMASTKVTQDAAFDLLRAASQTAHRKLRDIADDVILTGTLAPLP